MENKIVKLLILMIVSIILTSCSKVKIEDQHLIDSLNDIEIDKIILNYKSDSDDILEINSDDKYFKDIIKLSSSIKLKSKSNKKHLSGNVIIAKFYSKNDIKLMLEVRDGHVFVNSVLYKYTNESKKSVNNLEKILESYFDIN